MSVEDSLLVFADAAGVPRRWRLMSGGAVVGRGDEVAELPETRAWVRVVLAVPGTDVTLHWLELTETLTAVQAAAAARLQIAEQAPEPVNDLHVAAGRAERGLTCVAVVPAERMSTWIAAAKALGVEPDIVLPTPLLLIPPGEGLVRYNGLVPDYRGTARAFALEDDLAAVLIGGAPVTDVGDSEREAGFGPVLASPPINLRQGAFARRREWAIDWARVRRMAALAAMLLLLSVAIQLVVIMRTTFAADRVQTEAAELRRATPGSVRATAYAPLAGVVFEAVRDTPNVTVTQVIYQPDGTLRASLLADTPATIEQVRGRIEARGLQAVGALPTDLGGRAALQLTIRRP